MANVDIWPVIHSERAALAADLESITDEQWATESECPQWTVQQVLAHMTSAAKLTAPQFMAGIVTAGFRFETMQQKNLTQELGESPAATLTGFKAVMNNTSHPPGPNNTWLGEVIVHSQDIRRPLRIAHEYPMEAVVQAADFYKKSNLLIGSKKRIAGLMLRATDTAWEYGDGPEVSGPMASLVHAMVGRKGPLDDLSGDGVAELRSRS